MKVNLLQIQISTLGEIDLKNIATRTAKVWGIKQRNEYLKQINDRILQLAGNPNLGRSCEEIRSGYRRYKAGEHVIFYRIAEPSLEIVRILHKNMDVSSHLS